MVWHVCARGFFVLALAASVVAPAPGSFSNAGAAQPGAAFAYDSFSTFPADWTIDLASITPVPFDAGFTSASQTFLPGPGSSVSPDAARDALRSFRLHGIAARHYFFNGKQRVDDLSLHTSTITDCATNTITQLDNDRHTYRRFAAPAPAGPPGAFPHFAITLSTKALGMQTVGSASYPGFSAHGKVVVTAGPGFSSTSDVSLRAFASNAPSAASICAVTAANGAVQDPTGQAAFFQTLLAGILSKDPHFAVTRSGPPLPVGKLPVFSAIRRTLSDGSKPVTVVTQTGHFRALGPADAALFTVPPGYLPAARRTQTSN
jgi:hypothetical protein